MKTFFKQWKFAAVMMSIIGAVSICACSTQSNDIKVIEIGKAYDDRVPVMASEYFSSIEYIPLETNENSLLGGSNALALLPTDDRIVVLSRITMSPENHLKSFDYTGKLLEFNAFYGRAEEEYGNLRKIEYLNDEIYAFQSNGSVKIYDLLGNYKETMNVNVASPVNTPFLVADRTIGVLGDDIKNKTLSIDIIDKSGNRILGKPLASYSGAAPKERYIERNGMKIPIPTINSHGYFLKKNRKIFMIMKDNDTLYTVNDGLESIKAEYRLDHGKYVAPSSPRRVLSVCETDNFLILSVLFDRKLYNPPAGYLSPLFIYDEITGRTRVLPYNELSGLNGFTNDINDDALIFSPNVCYKNRMYQVIDAADFIELAEKSSSSKIKEVAAKLTEESNPVLVIGTLK